MSKVRVLLVDDEKDFRMLISIYIKRWGFELVEAENGIEALQKIKEYDFDLIILDHLMPKMDGVQTLRELRKIKKYTPVIMYTAGSEDHLMNTVEKLGDVSAIAKIKPGIEIHTELKKKIDEVLRK